MLDAEDRPSLEQMIRASEHYLHEASTPRDQQEADFLTMVAQGVFEPGVLFDSYPESELAAKVDPVALWKMRNLANALKKGEIFPRIFHVGKPLYFVCPS
jgi:hypothetical protein